MKKLLLTLLLAALLLPSALAEIHAQPVHPVRPAEEPEPTPTAKPSTSRNFKYDDLMGNPEDHKGETFIIVGTVYGVRDADLNIEQWTRPTSAIVSVDDETKQLIYVAFDQPEEPLTDGTQVRMVADCIGTTTEVETALGFYITMPVFVSFRVEAIE